MLLLSYEVDIKQISSVSCNHNDIFGDFFRRGI